MIHIQPRTGEVEAVGEGSRTGYKICHIKGHFWPFWLIFTSKVTYQLHIIFTYLLLMKRRGKCHMGVLKEDALMPVLSLYS